VGYVLGFNLSSKSTRLPPVAHQFASAPGAAGANPKTPDRSNERPAVQAAAPDLPTDARSSGQDPASIGAPQPPEPTGPRTVRPHPVPTPATVDASEIAARMKIGTELMASGDIAAARKMFERVAEAGEAAGAFALAETYDPVVLGTLRLRGAIMPDPALARSWYEKARDLGASAAPDRIARLARTSQ
jgi:TPR repeat protein